MHWFDFTVLGIMLVVIIVQTIRSGKGMGLILIETIGLLGCARLSVATYELLSRVLVISKPLALAGVFVISGVIWMFIASFLHSYTDWSMGQFDRFFGFIFGIVCAWTVGNMFLRLMIQIQGPDSTTTGMIVDSVITKEILYFRTFNSMFGVLNRAKIGGEPTTPDEVLDTIGPKGR